MIRVVFVSVDYPPAVSGVGDYVASLAGHLVELGVDVHVVTASSNGHPTSRGVRVDRLPRHWELRATPALARHVLAKRPNIVHFQHQNREFHRHVMVNILPSVIGIAAPRIQMVHTLHDPAAALGWRGRARLALSLTCCDGLVTVDDRCSALPPLHRLLVRQTRFRGLIPIASNIPRSLLRPADRAATRARLGVAARDRMLCFFGSLNARKGIDDLLRVVAGLGDSTQLVVISQYEPGNAYHQRVQELIAELGLAERVIVTGSQPAETVAEILSAADACVFPFTEGVSRRNGSFLAAVTQGVFVVTTSVTRHGYSATENVYYARLGDPAEMCKAVELYGGRHIRPNPRLLPSWEQIAEAHCRLYRHLCQTCGQSRQTPRQSPAAAERGDTP